MEQQYGFRAKRNNPRILDVGANVGLASLYFARQYPDALIEAYEADPVLYRILVKNLSLFPECSRVKAHCAAIWTSEGSISFRPDGADGGSICKRGLVQVRSVRLADILAESPIEFLKLDIEGAEYEVLEDCAKDLKNVGSMVVEYHGISGGKPRLGRVLQILENAGFRYYLCAEGVWNSHPLEGIARSGPFELQVNISCIRE